MVKIGTGNVVTNNGRIIALNRTFKATPDYTAPTKFRVGTGTNTPVPADSDLQTKVIISGGNYDKTQYAGYPVLDETAMLGRLKGQLSVSEANGNALTEFGFVNTDGTIKLFSRAVFTAINKTSSNILNFYEIDKIG